MRIVLLFALAAMGFQAAATVGDIRCVAKQFEVTEDKLTNEVEAELKVESRAGSAIVLTADIGDRGYVLSGDIVSGDFRITQAWGENYTTGISATASFNSSGRLVIVMVEVSKVFKLECTKTLASDFPRE